MTTNLTELEAQLRSLGADLDASNDDAPATSGEATGTEDSSPSQVQNERPTPETHETGQPSGATADQQNLGAAEADAATAGEPAGKPNQERRDEKPPAVAKPDGQEEGKNAPTGESPYAQAKREKREREAKAWQKIEEEKSRVRAEREQLDAERKRASEEAERSKARVPHEGEAGAVRDERGFSAEDYEQAARQFKSAGDEAMSEAALRQAGALRQTQSVRARDVFAREVQAGIAATLEKRPEFKDPAGEHGKAIVAVLNEFPILRQVPGGFAAAVGVLDARRNGAAFSGLQAKLEALTKENERLTKLTSLPGSRPAAPAREKSFSELTPKQQEARLRQMAAAADDGG
jgi:hypothetical protein